MLFFLQLQELQKREQELTAALASAQEQIQVLEAEIEEARQQVQDEIETRLAIAAEASSKATRLARIEGAKSLIQSKNSAFAVSCSLATSSVLVSADNWWHCNFISSMVCFQGMRDVRFTIICKRRPDNGLSAMMWFTSSYMMSKISRYEDILKKLPLDWSNIIGQKSHHSLIFLFKNSAQTKSGVQAHHRGMRGKFASCLQAIFIGYCELKIPPDS